MLKNALGSKLFKNSSMFLLGNSIAKLSTLILLPLYSWMIAPEDFGVIFTIQTIASLLMLTVPLAMSSAISRFFYDQKSLKQIKVLFSNGVIFTFFWSTFVYSFLFFFSENITESIEIENVNYLRIGLLYSYFSLYFPLV